MANGKLVAIYRPRVNLSFLIYEHDFYYEAVCEQDPRIQFIYFKWGGKNALASFKKKIRNELKRRGLR